jgi:hypothetical protein
MGHVTILAPILNNQKGRGAEGQCLLLEYYTWVPVRYRWKRTRKRRRVDRDAPAARAAPGDAPARCHHMPAPEAHRNVDHAPRTNTGGLMPRLVASREQLQPVR